MKTEQPLHVQFLIDFNNISPSELDRILEWLRDNCLLNKDGLELSNNFWGMFIKREEK